jgi:hypothetical protein
MGDETKPSSPGKGPFCGVSKRHATKRERSEHDGSETVIGGRREGCDGRSPPPRGGEGDELSAHRGDPVSEPGAIRESEVLACEQCFDECPGHVEPCHQRWAIHKATSIERMPKGILSDCFGINGLGESIHRLSMQCQSGDPLLRVGEMSEILALRRMSIDNVESGPPEESPRLSQRWRVSHWLGCPLPLPLLSRGA